MGLDLTSTPGAAYADWILPFIEEGMTQGQRFALLTLVGVSGSSPRPIGSQLAVREDGTSLGLISGGCVEPSLVLDALQAIREGRCRLERYGQGSRFIDLRLPCGSGIDVYFDVDLTLLQIRELIGARERREPVSLAIDTLNHLRWVVPGGASSLSDWSNSSSVPDNLFLRHYQPACRVVVAGAGQIMSALAQFCRLCEMEVEAITTDRPTSAMLNQAGFTARNVTSWIGYDWRNLDRWSAAILLSHDHDEEPDVLKEILETDAFYIGALGSKRTHARRCQLLAHVGVEQDSVQRIRGPVGLPIAAQTPPEIAASILAEIISQWRTSQTCAPGQQARPLMKAQTSKSGGRNDARAATR